ncbi:MAG: hypothetical protein ACE5G9_02220 [Nitrospinales bacterium]
MKHSPKFGFFLGLAAVVGVLAYDSPSYAKRPFFEYKGDYRENIQNQISAFKEAYGYDLLDLDVGWRPEQIRLMDEAFSQLPPGFYRLRGLKGFYRADYLQPDPGLVPDEDVQAATFPAFTTVYRGATHSHQVEVQDDYLRIEFYNPLFNEERDDIINIVQHEMAHAYDMAKGMISVSAEWLKVSHFRLIHLPPLDAKRDGDFLFTFLNDPAVDRYAPVSTRYHPNYSRQNPWEDFANSVAAYIHYPYFRHTNPNRYRFLKTKVFGGKEYFPSQARTDSYEQAVLTDLDAALKKKNWRQAANIMVELSRNYSPGLDGKVVARLRAAVRSDNAAARELGLGSCYLIHPSALEFRRDLVRQEQVKLEDFLANKRCAQMGRDWFEKALANLAPANVFFYRDKGRAIVQFFDPALTRAFFRGFKTEYFWQLGFAGKVPFAKGRMPVSGGGHGSVRIDLQESFGKELPLPFGEKLLLRLIIRRSHPKTFKVFHSSAAQIRFVVQPWFDYEGPDPPDVKVIFPLRLLFLEKSGK